MKAMLESLEALHTHTHTICLINRIIASFLALKLNLIREINRVSFVYMLVIPLRI